MNINNGFGQTDIEYSLEFVDFVILYFGLTERTFRHIVKKIYNSDVLDSKSLFRRLNLFFKYLILCFHYRYYHPTAEVIMVLI